MVVCFNAGMKAGPPADRKRPGLRELVGVAGVARSCLKEFFQLIIIQ